MTNPNPILDAAHSAGATSADVVSSLGSLDIVSPSDKADGQFASALLSIEESIRTTDIAGQNSLDELNQLKEAGSASLAILQGSIRSTAEAAATIALQKDTAELQAQNETINAVAVADTKAIQTQLLTELGQDILKVEALEDSINATNAEAFTGIGIIDDIINDFNSEDDRRALISATAQQATTERGMQALASGVSYVDSVNIATKRTVNEATIRANQSFIANEAEAKATQSELDTLNSNSKVVSSIFSANQQQLQSKLTALSLRNQVEQRTLQREKLAQQKVATDLALKNLEANSKNIALQVKQAEANLASSTKRTPVVQAKLELELKEARRKEAEGEKGREDSVNRVRKAQAFFGTQPKGTQESSAIIQAGIARRDPAYIGFLEVGAMEKPVYGDTPAKSKANFLLASRTGSIKPTRITKLLAEIERTTEEILNTKEKGTGQLPKRPRTQDDKDALFNRAARFYMEVKSREIKAGDNTNPLQAPPMATLLLSDGLKLEKLYTEILKPMNLTEIIPQQIVDAAASGVASKRITVDEAVSGLSTIFQMSALINAEQDNGFESIGLDSPDTYNTLITRPQTGFESFTGAFNSLTNPYRITRNISIASSAVIESLSEGSISKETLERLETASQVTRGSIENLADPIANRQLLINMLNTRASTVVDNADTNLPEGNQ